MKGINQMKDIFLGILDWCITSGIRLVLTVVVVFALWKGIDFILNKFVQSEKFKHLDLTLRKFLKTFIGYTLKVLLIVTAVNFIGINTSSFVAVLAAAGATIGLALQGGLSNLAGGVIIMLFKPFHEGDYISTPLGDGTVSKIGVFYTKLTTPDNISVSVPNSSLSNSTISNYSAKSTRRVDISLSISYEADIDLAKKVLLASAESHDLVLKDPAPVVFVTEQADSSIKLQLRVWVLNADYWTVRFDLTEDSKKVLDKFAISIPYPQLDVHVKND